jgi:hypothetical protein
LKEEFLEDFEYSFECEEILDAYLEINKLYK